MKDEWIPANHPRAESLRIREELTRFHEDSIIVPSGLIAHGRGEAFDYLLGEVTIDVAKKALKVAAAAILLAANPVISVNGNLAALCARDVVRLASLSRASVEINLFHRSASRERKIAAHMRRAGAVTVLGVGKDASASLLEILSNRRRVDPRGLLKADTVLLALEDGDRTSALRKMGKLVIAVDLNPLSRTAQEASITIVDNVIRVMPLLCEEIKKLRSTTREELVGLLRSYDNRANLSECLDFISSRLKKLAKTDQVSESSLPEEGLVRVSI